MSRCGGRNICGCGQSYCYWNAWGLLWWLIAWEMSGASPLPNPRRDNEDWNNRVRFLAGELEQDEESAA